MAPGEKLRELGGQLASGGLASAIAKTCVAPFDRTKILLQTSDVIAKSTPGHRSYTGVFDAFRRIPQEQGLSSFWRGNLTNCSRVVPTYALRFTFFDHFREFVSKGCDPTKSLPLSRQMAAGALSGTVTMLCTFPLDLLRTRMSAEVTAAGKARVYGSMVASAARIVRVDGVVGLYRGLGISLVEIGPYLAISFGGYEYLKSRFSSTEAYDRTLLDDVWSRLGCGWLSGVSASLICYPFDTMKRHLMVQNAAYISHTSVAQQTRLLSVVTHLYQQGGVRAFYRGCLINALNSGPAAALTFVANDTLRGLFGLYTKNQKHDE